MFGAVFDADWQVHITHAETLEGVRPMMGSKYVQARTEMAYQDAERFLKAGRKVLFTGSPCQVAGLRRFLRKEYANLLAVDFLCHGVPSPGVWRRYLREMTKQETTSWTARGAKSTTSPLPRIQDIRFRDKALGWGRYSFSVTYTLHRAVHAGFLGGCIPAPLLLWLCEQGRAQRQRPDDCGLLGN